MSTIPDSRLQAWAFERSRPAAVFGVLLGIALLAGCSGTAEVDVAPLETESAYDLAQTFEDRTGVPLAEAEAKLGMTPQTREIYTGAIDRGYVLASDILGVMPDLVECIEPLGFTVEYGSDGEAFFGLPDTSWTVVTPVGYEMTPADDVTIEACADKTVGPLENAFFNQPFSPERSEVWSTDGRREKARECIENAGYYADPEGPMQQYLDVAKAIADEQGSSECLEIVINGAE